MARSKKIATSEEARLFEKAGLLHSRAPQWFWNGPYDAAIGRFLSEDPIGFGAGDLNVFRYAENNPTCHVDPSGLVSEGGNDVLGLVRWEKGAFLYDRWWTIRGEVRFSYYNDGKDLVIFGREIQRKFRVYERIMVYKSYSAQFMQLLQEFDHAQANARAWGMRAAALTGSAVALREAAKKAPDKRVKAALNAAAAAAAAGAAVATAKAVHWAAKARKLQVDMTKMSDQDKFTIHKKVVGTIWEPMQETRTTDWKELWRGPVSDVTYGAPPEQQPFWEEYGPSGGWVPAPFRW